MGTGKSEMDIDRPPTGAPGNFPESAPPPSCGLSVGGGQGQVIQAMSDSATAYYEARFYAERRAAGIAKLCARGLTGREAIARYDEESAQADCAAMANAARAARGG